MTLVWKKVPPGKNHFHDFILQSKEKQILCYAFVHNIAQRAENEKKQYIKELYRRDFFSLFKMIFFKTLISINPILHVFFQFQYFQLTLALHGWIYQFEPHPLIRQFENQIEIRENNIILFCFVEKLHIIYFSKMIEVCWKKNKTVMYMICNC